MRPDTRRVPSPRALPGRRSRFIGRRGPHAHAGLLEALEPRELLTTVTWDGGGDGVSWFDSANWNNPDFPNAPLFGNVLPGGSDTASIGTGNAINFNGSGSYISISSGRALNLNGSLGLLNGATGGTYNLNSGSYSIGTGFSSATVNYSGGTFGGGGVTLNSSTLNLDAAVTAPAQFTFFNASSFSGNPVVGQDLIVQNGAGFNSSLTVAQAGGMTTAGIITLTSSGGANNSTLFANNGLTVAPGGQFVTSVGSGGTRTLVGNLINNGTVQIDQPTTFSTGNGVYTNNTDFNIGTTGSLSIGGNNQTFNQNAGTLRGSQRFGISSVTVNLNNGTLLNDSTDRGTLVVNSCTVNLAPAFTTPIQVTFLNANAFSGNPLSGQDLVIQNGAGFNSSISVAQTGGLTTAGIITLTSSGGASNSTLFASNGLTVAPGGQFVTSVGSGGTRTLVGNLVNNGTVQIDQPTTFSTGNGVYTNNTDFNIGATGSLSIGGNNQTFNQNAGTLRGIQRFGITSITVNLNNGTLLNDSTDRGTLVVSSSTVNLAQAFTTPIQVTFLNGNSFSGNPLAGQDLVVRNGAGFNSSLSVAQNGGLTTAGIITLTSSGGANNSTLFANNGLAVASGGLFITSVGSGGTRTLVGNLINNGTVQIDQPTTFNTGNGVYTNNANFNIGATGSLSIGGNSQTFNQNAGTLRGSQRFGISSVAVNLSNGTLLNDSTDRGTLVVSSSTVNLAAAFTTPIQVTFLNGNSFSGNPLAGQDLIVQNGNGFSTSLSVAQNGGLTTAGIITLTSSGGANNSTLLVNNGLTIAPGGSLISAIGDGGTRTLVGNLVNNGTVQLDHPTTFNTGNGVYTNSANFNIGTTGSLSIGGNNQTFNQNGGTLRGSQRFGINSITVNLSHGTLLNDASDRGTLVVSSSTVNLAQAFTTPIQITFLNSNAFSGNPLSGQDLVVQNGNGFNSSLSVAQNGGLTTAGIITLTSSGGANNSTLFANNGLTVASGGLFITSVGSGGTRTLVGNLINNGTVQIDQPTTFSTGNGVYTNNTNFNIGATGSLSIGGNNQTFNQNGGTLRGSQRFGITSITVNLNNGTLLNDASDRGTLVVNSSTVNLAAAFTTPIQVTFLNGNAFSGNPLAGQDLIVRNGSGFNSSLTVPQNGGLTTAGMITLTSFGGANNSTLIVNNGLTVASGGSLISAIGDGGTRTLVGNLINNGTVQIDQPTTFSTGNGVYTNNALFNITTTGVLNIAGNNQTFNQAGGTLVGTQRTGFTSMAVNLTGGALLNDGTDRGTLIVNSSTVNLAPAFTTPFQVTFLNANTFSGNPLNGQDLIIQNGSGFNSSLSVPQAGGMTTGGIITLSSSGGPNNSTLIVNNGLTIAAGGSIISATGSGGTRSINAAVTNAGRITLESGMVLTVNGTLTLTGTSTINTRASADNAYGRLNVTGFSSYDGTLSVGFEGEYIPGTGTQFTSVVTTASLDAQHNTFASAGVDPASGNFTAQLNYRNANRIVDIQVFGAPFDPLDFNQDGFVNADDISDFITGYFDQPQDQRCDFNNDGFVNADDLGDYITAYFSR